MNGCSLTLNGLYDDTDTQGQGGTIEDTSTGLNGSPAGATVLTIAVPNGVTEDFSGNIDDSYSTTNRSAASIRVVKTGGGEFDLGGDDCESTFSGGFLLADGRLVMECSDTDKATTSPLGSNPAMEIQRGTFDLNGHETALTSLNGSGGIITDDSDNPDTTTPSASAPAADGRPACSAGKSTTARRR